MLEIKGDPQLRYLTSEEAEKLPLEQQLERLREINRELVNTHNGMVHTIARLEEELRRFRAQEWSE